MSDKDCPDKLEPSPDILTSVLKNVPIELMWHLREYQSRPSHYQIKWRARQPVEGKKYGYGGDLKFEYAQSADMYVRDRVLEEKHSELRERYREQDGLLDEMLDNEKELKNKNADLKRDLDVLQYDYDGVVRFTEMHRDMDAKYEKLEKEYKDLLTDHMDGEEWKARHDDLLHQVQDVERGKAQEWTDDMLEQADKDYDAVTKGVISFINLLRR